MKASLPGRFEEMQVSFIPMSDIKSDSECDLFIIGGGINGCGIARDAAGRGLSVRLAEMADLGSATSSASTKLFHGGLRYLEHFEFRLVREALIERETLLYAMPHISWPMRFVLPIDQELHGSRNRFISWRRGRRPAWMIRAGLFLYDTLGGRKLLPATRTIDLCTAPEGKPLEGRFKLGFEYSDCWVDDARLVVLNARDAAERGAEIMVGTRVISARRRSDHWELVTKDRASDQVLTHHARVVVNATGPWVVDTLQDQMNLTTNSRIRFVRGSHIVIPRLYDHERCYILQGDDGRVIFTIPYEGEYTLVGTTDAEHDSPDRVPHCSEEECDYLTGMINRYFRHKIDINDIVWSYSGVRPLHDDGSDNASTVTRDYSLELDANGGAPALSVFGGKITTYRRLAENAVNRLSPYHDGLPGGWTAGIPLPGGDFPHDGMPKLVNDLLKTYPFLDTAWAHRLARTYGADAAVLLGPARSEEDLGARFTSNLTGSEVNWMIDREFARCADDILWRRSKLGLLASPDETAALERYVDGCLHRSGHIFQNS